MGLLYMECRGMGPHLAETGSSHGCSRVAVRNWGIFLSYGGDGHSKFVFVQGLQDSFLVMRDTSGIPTSLGRSIQTLLEVMPETEFTFLVCTVILGFLSIFKYSQALSPFEALNSTCLSSCQRNMRPLVQMMRGHRDFSRFSALDSDIPSSCELKDELALKPLQENLAFFQVRASRFPFYFRQQTQGPSHLHIAEGSLLLRCLWKVGLPLQSKQGISSHLETIWGARSFPQVAVLKFMFL